MSLFENDEYRWRDTYFVLFHVQDRPTLEQTLKAIESLGPRYKLHDVRRDDEGRFESLTLLSPDDFAAMDISYVAGEEVEEQVEALIEATKVDDWTKGEQRKWKALKGCNARFDIYHFEQVVLPDDEEDEGYLDPGALLIVLECLVQICQGIGIDPQSGTVV